MSIPLNLSAQEVEIVLHGLGELPLKVSANVFQKVRAQRDEALRTASQTDKEGD